MQHRHLNHNTHTLAATNDVIARGARVDWQVQQKIQRVCATRANDRYAQRHAFWALYVERQTA